MHACQKLTTTDASLSPPDAVGQNNSRQFLSRRRPMTARFEGTGSTSTRRKRDRRAKRAPLSGEVFEATIGCNGSRLSVRAQVYQDHFEVRALFNGPSYEANGVVIALERTMCIPGGARICSSVSNAIGQWQSFSWQATLCTGRAPV